MLLFKNNPKYNLYYTDTDSIFIDKPLSDNLVSEELGKMKLEYVLKDAVFLAPKVYAGMTDDGKFISKIKGFTDKSLVTLEDLEGLLVKGSYKSLKHTKWFRNMSEGSISIMSTPYNLVQTQNKRTIVFNDQDKAIDSKAFTIKN
uniref:DNA polymerase n=1 Tax=Coniophora puteana TaxID=80637 RepID=A0A896YS35_9AGAM